LKQLLPCPLVVSTVDITTSTSSSTCDSHQTTTTSVTLDSSRFYTILSNQGSGTMHDMFHTLPDESFKSQNTFIGQQLKLLTEQLQTEINTRMEEQYKIAAFAREHIGWYWTVNSTNNTSENQAAAALNLQAIELARHKTVNATSYFLELWNEITKDTELALNLTRSNRKQFKYYLVPGLYTSYYPFYFSRNVKHLKQELGYDIEVLKVGDSSAEDAAKVIYEKAMSRKDSDSCDSDDSNSFFKSFGQQFDHKVVSEKVNKIVKEVREKWDTAVEQLKTATNSIVKQVQEKVKQTTTTTTTTSGSTSTSSDNAPSVTTTVIEKEEETLTTIASKELSATIESSPTNSEENKTSKQQKPTKKRIVFIGHSKGSVDTATALAMYPDLRAQTELFISLQGPIGGSAFAHDLMSYENTRTLLERLLKLLLQTNTDAIRELTYDKRREMLMKNPALGTNPCSFNEKGEQNNSTEKFPFTISLATRSDNMKSIMYAVMQYLQLRYKAQSDGLVSFKDAVIPGSAAVVLDDVDHCVPAFPFFPNFSQLYGDPGLFTEAFLEMAWRMKRDAKQEHVMCQKFDMDSYTK